MIKALETWFEPCFKAISKAVSMAREGLRPVASLLLLLNFCMCPIVASIGGWALNFALDHTYVIGILICQSPPCSMNITHFISENPLAGPGLALPEHFSPVYFPMGNNATGFFTIFALIAGAFGMAAAIAGVHHLRSWRQESLPSAVSSALTAWGLTLLAMGWVIDWAII